MKVKSEDILKPGAVLEVRKIDFNDPEIRAFVEQAKREQSTPGYACGILSEVLDELGIK